MPGSVRFDRAADEYDRTRAISDDAMAQTIELLSSEFAGRGRVLEVGVGTGLLALPLHRADVPLAGIDLTPAMLGKLLDKAGGRPPFPLALADATAMPFPDGAFGGAYLRWVLHLIADWRSALREMVRVVRPGGVVLVNLGEYDDTRFEVQRRFAELAGISTDPLGLFWGDVGSLDAEMAITHGADLRMLPPVREEDVDTLEEFLEGIEEGRWSWTWRADDAVRRLAVAQIRPWAAERFGPLDRVERYELATLWRAYDLPGREG
ncbi:MAG: class I SAM-dependent methyltransferase [Actinobacteria bacterium]|nr:class I SAM-dependent methyltransferase [Actinomycetota bacterium]